MPYNKSEGKYSRGEKRERAKSRQREPFVGERAKSRPSEDFVRSEPAAEQSQNQTAQEPIEPQAKQQEWGANRRINREPDKRNFGRRGLNIIFLYVAIVAMQMYMIESDAEDIVHKRYDYEVMFHYLVIKIPMRVAILSIFFAFLGNKEFSYGKRYGRTFVRVWVIFLIIEVLLQANRLFFQYSLN